jgi:hypothetical protein
LSEGIGSEREGSSNRKERRGTGGEKEEMRERGRREKERLGGRRRVGGWKGGKEGKTDEEGGVIEKERRIC